MITLATAGTGVVAAGDIITFAGDTNKYVVDSVVFAGANPAAGDTITLAAPGLRKAHAASAIAITVVATSTRNVAFRRSALELVARAPSVPVIGGVARDAAVDRMTVVDPRSGLPFEVSVYLGQGKAMIQVASAWGVKAWKMSISQSCSAKPQLPGSNPRRFNEVINGYNCRYFNDWRRQAHTDRNHADRHR